MTFLINLLHSMPGAIAQGMIWGIMAIGVYITYRILDVADLTVDGSLCTGGAVCVLLTINGVPLPIAFAMAFISGLLAGLVTGVFNTRFGIPPILAGILTQLALYSINLHIMGWDASPKGDHAKHWGSKANLPVSVDKYKLLVSQRHVNVLGLKNPIWALIIILCVIIFLLYWFFGTEIGASLRATGANGNMARAQGIDTDKTKILGLMISNGFVAFSGALLAQYQGFADINMGRGAIVIGLAAVIIGSVIFGKISGGFTMKLTSCILGAIIYYIVIQVVLRMGLSTDDLKLLSAAVVALFLAVPYWRGKYFVKAKGGK